MLLSARDRQMTGDRDGALDRVEGAMKLLREHDIDTPPTDLRFQTVAGVSAFLARMQAEAGDVASAVALANQAITSTDEATEIADRFLLRPTLLGIRARLDAAIVFDLNGDAEGARAQRLRALELIRSAPGAGDGVCWRLVFARALLDNGDTAEASRVVSGLLATKTSHLEVLEMAKTLGLPGA